MKLARYWARAWQDADGPRGHMRAEARGWSNQSLDEARAVARQTAGRIAQRLAAGDIPKNQYLYGDRPLPEPVVREFVDASETGPRAVVTRNVYGALVLNTRDLMFVDIDREDRSVPDNVRRVLEASGVAGRIYRTAAGHRVILTNAGFQAGSADADAWLQQFGADPLYVKLCKAQESFRARLTPKPWRCDLSMPPESYPFETPDAEGRFYEWVRKYNAATQKYATCQLVAETGSVHPAFADLVTYHDQEAKVGSGAPLA
jgi:hypothetical protein